MLFMAPALFATTETIMAGGTDGMSFVPASGVTISLGDTIKWVWEIGDHTTTSTTIPGGAAAWDHDITSVDSVFIYVPTVAGIYSYKCVPHESMGMLGSFTVMDTTTGITEIPGDFQDYVLSPNPASSSIQVTYREAEPSFQIYDISGRLVGVPDLTNKTNSKAVLDVSMLAEGNYFLRIQTKEGAQTRKFTINR
jgi:plastocyanin